jgi:hypothetical protein
MYTNVSIIWIINTAFMLFFPPPLLNRHYAKNQGKVKEKSCSCRIKRASVSFRETKFHTQQIQKTMIYLTIVLMNVLNKHNHIITSQANHNPVNKP